MLGVQLTPTSVACVSCTKALSDGSHLPAMVGMNHGQLTGEHLPPGVSANWGEPKSGASPFLQAHLPRGFSHNGRKSRSVSFLDSSVSSSSKGTSRSREEAIRCVLAWCWEWWNALPEKTQRSIKDASDANVGSVKKRRGES